ncbi:High affinity sulfate transporter, putative [Pediculus humanus corporis]|uniref:High affinity sulfate transporter, putative n=1 Tax=Pediculus humanus subsp. corporis TaxID=121224 RepID=E0VH85_PEDHC|nr:High affinity sulfate transporter, putative [Pediculus humanus corporis]EEB12741.1 High affinity sulfate transporter, putative [Pediculus humanus corporis]
MTIKCDNINVRKIIEKKFPIVKWLPKYKLSDIFSDFVAGITVGLTLIPQAIAYSALAGLEPQYGLYSGFAGTFVYIFFGTVKQVNIGPTAVVSLLTYSYTKNMNSDFAVLLCFLAGVVEFVSGLLHLGSLVEFVSVPVTAGFSSAAALIIASSQIKGLLGISIDSENFFQTITEVVHNLSKTRRWDLILSICCCTILLLLRKLKDVKLNFSTSKKLKNFINRGFWLLSTSRNALVVIACATSAYFLSKESSNPPFLLTGEIQPGFPQVSLPPFSTTVHNRTYNFIEMCSHLGKGIIIVPLVSLLNNVAIAKAFASDGIFDGSQEMMTLGLCNIVASFFKSMPISGSFSRSAVNNASGVQSPLGNFFTGSLVILALGFLTPYFYYIPKATLSSVIVCAVIFMVEIRLIKQIWISSKKDLIPAFATFIICLWIGVEVGIFIGVTFDIIYLLYLNARPQCEANEKFDCLSFCPKFSFLYLNIDYIRTKVNHELIKKKNSNSNLIIIIIDCSYVQVIDYSAVQGLKSLIKDCKEKNHQILFYKMNENLEKKLGKFIGHDFVHVKNNSESFDKEFFENLKLHESESNPTEIDGENLEKFKMKNFIINGIQSSNG